MKILGIRERRWGRGLVPVLYSHSPTLPPSRTSLFKNNIGPEGVRALAETLRTNTTLTKLEWVESVWNVCLALILEIYIFITFLFYIGVYFKKKDLNIERGVNNENT